MTMENGIGLVRKPVGVSRRVFLSHGPNVQIAPIRNVLHSLGWLTSEGTDVDLADSLAEELLARLTASEVVLVVTDAEDVSNGVLVEAGAALGLGKPLGVLDMGRDQRGGPSPLSIWTNNPTLYARAYDTVAIRQELQSFLDSLVKRSHQPVTANRDRSMPALQGVMGITDESISRVANAFAAVGGTVQATASSLRAPDLLVTLPGFDLPFSPVAVEVLGRKGRVRRAIDRLEEALTERDLRLGVLVTLEPVENSSAVTPLGIIVVPLRLLEEQAEVVVRQVRDARNRIVHGA
ncbi:MAG: hypothetical protein QOE23_3132 [Pseudonocardiales bacterium]|jgi:hypothetical protein|nr:hypothetical protein [Pseudonocardiales bacterium]